MKKAIHCLLFCVFCAIFNPSAHADVHKEIAYEGLRTDKLEYILIEKIKSLEQWVADPKIQYSIQLSNQKHTNISKKQILKLDHQWKQNELDDQFFRSYLNDDCRKRLITYRSAYPEFTEIFITDKYGLNVCQTNKTSDFYQADESWWVKAYNDGRGQAYFGSLEYDASSMREGIALYVPIYTSQNQLIGLTKAFLDCGYIKDTLYQFTLQKEQEQFNQLTIFISSFVLILFIVIFRYLKYGKHVSIARKFFLGFSGMLILVLIFGVVVIKNVSQMDRQFNFFIQHDAEILSSARNLEKLNMALKENLINLYRTREQKYYQAYLRNYNEMSYLIESQKKLISDHPTQLRTLLRIEKLFGEFHQKYLLIMENKEFSVKKRIQQFVTNNQNFEFSINKYSSRLAEELNVFIRTENKTAQQRYESAKITAKRTQQIIIVILIAILVISLLLISHITALLTAPLLKLKTITSEITKRNFSFINEVKTNDEIGLLSDSLNIMKEELQKSYEDLERKSKALEDQKYALDQHSIVAITDADGRITYVNEKFCELSGYSKDELIGKTHRIINSGFHSKEFFKDLWSTIKSGKIWKNEVKNKNKDGSYYWVDTTIFPFLDDRGQPYQYLAIRTDVTERKRLEAMKENFVSSVSHELRTPLTIMKERVSQIVDGLLGPTTEKQMKALKSSANNIIRLEKIINDLLDIAKINAGKIDLEISKGDIVELANDVTQSLKFKAEAKGLEIREKYDQSSLELQMDKTRIYQVLTNLVNNAIKFTEKGYIEIEIKDLGHEVLCCVRDTGRGLSPDDLSRLFNRFEQFGRKEGAGEKGTGLGLSISKALVELHQGRIEVSSELGQGSQFRFYLPKQQETAS